MPPKRPGPQLPLEIQGPLTSSTPAQLRTLLAQVLAVGASRFPGLPETPTLLRRRRTPVTFRIRVDLDDVKPPIWRRLEVASDLSLEEFHDVLQVAMGWTNSHLHAFRRLGTEAGRFEPAFLTEFDVLDGEQGTPEVDARLDEVLAAPGDKLRYTYDFGDGWDHTIKLEAVLDRGDDAPAAHCVTGRRACPPEDCGGPWGYQDVLELLSEVRAGKPVPEDMNYLVEAFGHHQSEQFSVEEVNQDLADGPLPALFPSEDEPHAELDVDGLPQHIIRLLSKLPLDLAREVLTLAREALPHSGLTATSTPQELEELTHDVRWLLDRIGEDGVTLTAAGYLPPAVVRETYVALNLQDEWRGGGGRESETLPVLLLRTSLQDLGLLRKNKGRLLLTMAAKKLRSDPARLVQHVAERLPQGRQEYEQVAGRFALLAVASGRLASADDVVDLASRVLTALGWDSGDGGVGRHGVIDAARPTFDVLARMAVQVFPDGRHSQPSQSPAAVRFARSVLTSS
ncbi:MAG: plasmid pRiA4b ORF-3 family protein [Janthinobacterium lividum]